MISRNRAVIGIGLAVLALGAWSLLRPMSLERHAARLMGCVIDRDAACVLEYMDSTDKSVYKMDVPRTQLLLTELAKSYTAERSGIKVDARPTTTDPEAKATIFSVVAPAKVRKTGKNSTINFQVSDTVEGVKSPQFVASILGLMAVAEIEGSGGEAKIQAFIAFARNQGPTWTDWGFPGIHRSIDEGLVTWEDWAARNEAYLKRAKERAAERSREAGGTTSPG